MEVNEMQPKYVGLVFEFEDFREVSGPMHDLENMGHPYRTKSFYEIIVRGESESDADKIKEVLSKNTKNIHYSGTCKWIG